MPDVALVPRVAAPALPGSAEGDLAPAVAALAEQLMRASAPVVAVASDRRLLLNDLVTPAIVHARDDLHAAACSLLPEPDVVLGPVAVFAVRDVRVASAARLRIDGPASVVFVQRLTIGDGGALEVLARLRLFVGTLTKLDR